VASTSSGLLERAWSVDPQVSVRPEPFGALLYHFGTRRLSFLKDRRLLDVVRSLEGSGSARDACTVAEVPDTELPRFEQALRVLAESGMIRERCA
jgi:putative mycofactocin binding protein MftB